MFRRTGRLARAHLVLFQTEGLPFDAGKNLTTAGNRLLNRASGHFATVTLESPRTLRALDSSWGDVFTDMTGDVEADELFSSETYWQPIWARLGLFRWKPRLIEHRLASSEVRDGDIVFYHDVDLQKYSDYDRDVERWAAWIEQRMSRADVLGFNDNNTPLFADTKPELWRKYMSEDQARGRHHIWAGALGVRKNPAGIAFVNAWSALCDSKENLLPATEASVWPDFAQHSVDQAVLSCLWHTPSLTALKVRKHCEYLHCSRRIPPPSLPERFKARFSRLVRRAVRTTKKSLISKGLSP